MRSGAALLLAATVAAQEAAPVQVELHRLDGGTERIALERIQDDTLHAAGGAAVALREVSSLRFLPAAAVERVPTTSGELWLRSGMQLRGRVLGGKERLLRFKPVVADRWFDVPIAQVRAIRFEEPAQPEFMQALAQRSAGDMLFARSGETVRRLGVAFEGFDADAGELLVSFQGKTQRLPYARVHGILFGEESGAAADPLTGMRVTAVLSEAPPLQGRLVELAPPWLRLELDDRVTTAIELKHLRALHVQSDAMRYLSDLQPAVEQTPAFDRVWPWHVDRAHAGGAIRVGGSEHERGLALIPRTRLTFDLGKRYDWFGAVAGLEERAGQQAHAILRVYGDGRLLFDSGALTPQTAPATLKLPVTNVERLTLEADFGERFDLGDHCVFASARVWRQEKD